MAGKYLELTGKFQTRVSELDAEHQRLVDIINHMYDIYRQRRPEQEVLLVLDELLDYGAHHFADEEVYMGTIGAPGLDAHKQIHKNLLDQAAALKDRLQSGQEGVGEETFKFLQNWLMNHIAGTDIRDYGVSEAEIDGMSDEQLQRLANSLADYTGDPVQEG